MGRVGRTRFVEFRDVDVNSNPINDRVLANFQVLFLRDDSPCADSLTLVNLTNLQPGRYVMAYVPSAPGHDFLSIYDPDNDIRVDDSDDIDSLTTFFGGGSIVSLTQNTGGINALQLAVANPQTYTLYVFKASDWQLGLKNPLYAVKSTALDSQGNWVTSPLTVLPDIYTIAALNQTGSIVVLASRLDVSSGSTSASSSGGFTPPPGTSASGTFTAYLPTPATDGITTVFTLPVDPNGKTVLVFMNGLLLASPGDYSLTGVTLTLTFAPAPTDSLIVYF